MNTYTQFISSLTSLGISVFKLPKGQKKPAGSEYENWQLTTPGSVSVKEDDNYGIIVPQSYLVIDVDLYKQGALEAWERLRTEYALNTSTFTCRSARGGLHYWYRIELSSDSIIPPKHPSFLGVDFLTDRNGKRSYVVGPGSTTVDGEYTIVFGDISNCAPLPLALVDELTRPHTTDERLHLKSYEGIAQLIDISFELEQYTQFLHKQPGLVDGEGREQRAYILAAEGRDYGLSEQQIFNALRDEWNDTCSPPLELGVLRSKVQNVFKYAKDTQGNKTTQIALFEGFADDTAQERTKQQLLLENGVALNNGPFVNDGSNVVSLNDGLPVFDWYDDTINGEWDTDIKTGGLKSTSRNLRRLFQSDTVCDGRFTFEGLIRWDLLSERPVLTQQPFWRQFNDTTSLVLGDSDAIALKFFFANRYKVEFNVGQIYEVFVETAKRSPFHPVREWLESLQWDNVERLPHLFLEYFEVMPEHLSAEDTKYRKALAVSFALSAIERVFTPGCKWDTMLTLVGPQGTGKSEFVQIMGGKYAAVSYSINTDHRTLQALQGGWIIEFPELAAATKANVDSIKGFTSTRVDKFIPLHGKSGPQEYPRKSVYVWTLNPPPEGFLRDVTGERRFLILDVENKVDLTALSEDRDLIFAEAMHLYRQGKRAFSYIKYLYETNMTGRTILESFQQKYKQTEDPWMDILYNYIYSRPEQVTSQTTKRVNIRNNYGQDSCKYVPITVVETEECFTALGMHVASQRDQKAKIRITRAMYALGFESVSSNGRRRYEKIL